MNVERSNFILVPNSALSTNVFLQSKCNMHDRYDHASWSWCSCIALLEQSSLIMPDFDLTGELSLKIELHMLRPITEKVHSGNGPVSLVRWDTHMMADYCCSIKETARRCITPENPANGNLFHKHAKASLLAKLRLTLLSGVPSCSYYYYVNIYVFSFWL